MKTLLFFESTVQSVSQSTAWYLADLGEYLGRQELYARQVPQKLKVLKEADISIRKMIPQNILKTEGVESSQKTTQKILEAIAKKSDITQKELAAVIGITEDGVKYHITRLRKKGILKRIGPDKGRHWEIVTGK